jgi:hypothetical protein
MSREQRKAAFLATAAEMFDDMEEWYDRHAGATFEEIEAQMREKRRQMMGETLSVLINGRSTGRQVDAPRCPQCGSKMKFVGYRAKEVWGLEGESRLERAYYVCPGDGETLFPLDEQLKLERGHWSGGAKRVIVKHGLMAPSFERGAELFTESVGLSVSGESVRQVTEEFGGRIKQQRSDEVDKVYAEKAPLAAETAVEIHDSLADADEVNLSSDGGMIHLREEAWREVKMSVWSETVVEEQPDGSKKVRLKRHSYQVGLWDADTLGKYQYLEGVRRGVKRGQRMSSVNDGAPWIARVTTTNYPGAVMILDWTHACQHVKAASEAALGGEAGRAWYAQQEEWLWHGAPEQVMDALQRLDEETHGRVEDVSQTWAYIAPRQSMMRYDEFRAQGFPVGSGTVESGIRTVVHHRMKRQGRGWQTEHAQSMLAALAEYHSGRLDALSLEPS